MSKKLTIQDVFDRRKIMDFTSGFKSFFDFGRYSVSIVGGKQGLYGDFIETFEVAIIDNTDKKFVTKLFCGGTSDVLGYLSVDEVENILNIFTGVLSPKKKVVE